MKKGDFVKVTFTGKVEGQVVDTTEESVAKKEGVYDKKRPYMPVPVIVGEGMVLPGIDTALSELDVGKEKEVKLAPKDAFGERDPSMLQLIPLREFKKQNVNPVPGMVFEVEGRPARVQSVSGGRVRIDFNHPLAGKEADYKIKITEAAKTEGEKLKYLIERSFVEDVPAKIEGAGEKKRVVVEIPEKLRMDRALVGKKAGIVAEAAKFLNIKEVEFKELWVRK